MANQNKDRALVQDKCQSFLNELLRDDDNKYCVDCDAKGPRWASWNLGIFLCIRCAGIHRNLGVHISKVKSINLDSWTPEQVGHLMHMGNSRARAIYEAHLPDDFRRPQSDSSLETFIRAKYEHKKYIAKEWAPNTPPPAFDIEQERQKDRELKRNRNIGNRNGPTVGPVIDVQNSSVPRPNSSPAGTVISADKVPKDSPKGSSSSGDPFGLSFTDSDVSPKSTDSDKKTNDSSPAANNSDEDLFGAFTSADPVLVNTASVAITPTGEGNKSNGFGNSEEADFFNQKAPEDKKLDLESILKLYDNAGSTGNSLFTNQTANAFNGNLIQQTQTNNYSTNQLAGHTANPLASGHFPSAGGSFGQLPQTDLFANTQGNFATGQSSGLMNQTSNPAAATNPFLASSTSNPYMSQQPLQQPLGQINQQIGSLHLGSNFLATNPMLNNHMQMAPDSAPLTMTSPTNYANPFAAAPPTNGSFGQFNSTSNLDNGTKHPASSLDTLSWGFVNTNKPLVPSNNLWQ